MGALLNSGHTWGCTLEGTPATPQGDTPGAAGVFELARALAELRRRAAPRLLPHGRCLPGARHGELGGEGGVLVAGTG